MTELFSNLTISEDSGEESEAECPGCGLVYGSSDDDRKWVQCEQCEGWWDIACAGVDEQNIAQTVFVCSNCI